MDDNVGVRLKRLLDEKLRPHAERVVATTNDEFDFLPAALYQAALSSSELSAGIIARDQLLARQAEANQGERRAQYEELSAQIKKTQNQAALSSSELSAGIIARDQLLARKAEAHQGERRAQYEELSAQIKKLQKHVATVNYVSLGIALVTLILAMVVLAKR